MSMENKKDEKGRFVKGCHFSPATEFKKGSKPWNKGKKGLVKGYWLGKKRPDMIERNKKLFTGKKLTEEHKQKLRGHIAWNKGLKGIHLSPATEFKKGHMKGHKINLGRKHTKEARINMGLAKKGEKHPMYGRKHTDDAKRKMSEKLKGRPPNKGSFGYGRDINGKNSYNWKGGITPEKLKIRKSIEYRLWREAVFARDNWTCQKCKGRSGEKLVYLHPHHIQNFAHFPELRFAIDNGITFCMNCHKEFHDKYGRQNNTREQLIEFLNNK